MPHDTHKPDVLAQSIGLVQECIQTDITKYFNEYQESLSDIPGEWLQIVVRWLHQYCDRSGKALRPLLLVLGAALSRGESIETVLQDKNVHSLMMAVELLHKRLLMADDVADGDEMRQGGPAFHIFVENELKKMPQYASISDIQRQHVARSFTEIAGVLLQNIVSDLVLSLDISDEQRQKIRHIFTHYAYSMTAAGWYITLDQNFLPVKSVKEVDFLEGLRLVTGEYTFVTPLFVGAVLGVRSENLEQIFRAYGQSAGVLFQITDDIIGVVGEAQITGKPVGNDFREGKKTLLVQHAVTKLKSEDKKRFCACIGNPDLTSNDIAWLQEQVEKTGAITFARTRAHDFAVQARATLHELPEQAEKKIFFDIIDFIENRSK